MTVTIDRPKANAIDGPTSRALGAAFIAYRDDPELRAAIITAVGDRFFSAGWDLNSAEEEAVEVDNGPGGYAGLTELFDLRKPVIAAVNGIAAGGGFELALSCDLVLAAGHAEFLLPEVNIGIVQRFRTIPRGLVRNLLVEVPTVGIEVNDDRIGQNFILGLYFAGRFRNELNGVFISLR